MALKGKIILMQSILTKIKKQDSFPRGLAIILKENLKNVKINTNGIGL